LLPHDKTGRLISSEKLKKFFIKVKKRFDYEMKFYESIVQTTNEENDDNDSDEPHKTYLRAMKRKRDTESVKGTSEEDVYKVL
jgi:hypothetical protein